MPKTESEITYNSNINDFLNYKAVSEILTGIESDLKQIDQSIVTVLETEINEGGLDLYAANINGVPIFHNKGVELQQEIQKVYTSGIEEIANLDKIAKEHRRMELNKYKQELSKYIDNIGVEIETLETKLQNAKNAYEFNKLTAQAIPYFERPFSDAFSKAKMEMKKQEQNIREINSEMKKKSNELAILEIKKEEAIAALTELG